MYEKFYGLQERPFTLLPDPDYLYLSPKHKLAKAYLEYGLGQRVGFVVLTGEVGAGKTTLIKSLLKSQGKSNRLGVLYQTSVGAEDLLELLLREFEVRGHFSTRAAKLAAFNQFLISAYGRGEHVVLMVDEAQNLGPEALEELRLLSNLQTDKDFLLQVILVGQPGLRERLRHPSLRQLAQRVAVHYHLCPLERLETREYIRFRMARAGGSGIFTEEAMDRLYEYTQGVPRRLNAWCDLTLVAGFAEGRREIDADFIDTVVSAQGGTLEGEENGEVTGSNNLTSAFQTRISDEHGSSNNLKNEVMALEGRLTKMEGLLLDMTSQLIPAFSIILPRVMANASAELTIIGKEQDALAAPITGQNPPGKCFPPPPKGWWSKFWRTNNP